MADASAPQGARAALELATAVSVQRDEGAQVDKLTLGRLYTYDYQTLPGDGTAILVLTSATAKPS